MAGAAALTLGSGAFANCFIFHNFRPNSKQKAYRERYSKVNAVAPSYRSRPCAHSNRTRGKDDETGDYPPPGGNRHLAGKSSGLDG